MTRRGPAVVVFVIIVVLLLGVLFAGGAFDGGDRVSVSLQERAQKPGLGSSGSGLVGIVALLSALLGAAGTHWFRENSERQREHRERAGLLRLLAGEIKMNRVTWDGISADIRVLRSVPQGASAEAWDVARVRLGQLLPEEDFPKLVGYYDMVLLIQHYLRNLLDARERGDLSDANNWSSSFKGQLDEIGPREFAAREVIDKYIG